MTPADLAAETAVRSSYGRLLALLIRRTGNVAQAEDALADAVASALATWPERGVPDNPDAWLLAAARRKFLDARARADERGRSLDEMAEAEHVGEAVFAAAGEAERSELEDERLKLLFMCAHPAIEPAMRTPLMLQTVLGLDAKRIAAAFLTPPSAMAQRLVRVKRKIAAAKIPFEEPRGRELRERAASVIETVYAAFGASYDDQLCGAEEPDRLADEALFLARLTARLLPEEAEAHGLVALICYVHARRAARRAGDGYTRFDDQDTSLWDKALIAEADDALTRAAVLRKPGRCQLEAAIQSAHMTRRLTGAATQADVVRLYERLLAVAPSLGARIGRAAALVAAATPVEALKVLRALDPDLVKTHQPYWATLAAAQSASGDLEKALDSYSQAIGLSQDPALRRFLLEKRAEAMAQVRRAFHARAPYAAASPQGAPEKKAFGAAPERAAHTGGYETKARLTPLGPGRKR